MTARLLLVLYLCLLTLMPALLLLWQHGALAAFWLLAGDAYLYIGIAQNSAGPGFSFDGERPTNGFHPLWQIWVRLMALLAGEARLVVLNLAAWSAVAFTLAGTVMLGLAIWRLTGSRVLAMLPVPGVYYLLIGQGLNNLSVWAFFDGMEAALAFALSGMLALQIAALDSRGERAGHWLAMGAVLAALVLTRLDEVFSVAALFLSVALWPGKPAARRLRDALLLVLPAVLALALYMLWSRQSMGLWLPISGMAKGEGALISNLWVTAATFLAPLPELRGALSAYEPPRDLLLGAAFRVVQLLVPAAFAALAFALIRRRFRRAAWAPLLAGLCAGVVAKAAYSFIFVNFWHQAGWYFALAMASTTLAAALLLAPALRRATEAMPRLPLLLGAALAGFALLHASLWASRTTTSPWQAEVRDFWLQRGQTETALRQAEGDTPKLMEFGDGILNAAMAFPVRHGFVFAGDRESLDALRAGRLLHEAYGSGYRLLASFEYLRLPGPRDQWQAAYWPSEALRGFLLASFLDPRVKAELDAFEFELVHVYRPAGVPFIRFTPRAIAPPAPAVDG